MVHGRVPWLKGPDVELMISGCLKYFDQVKLAWLECFEIIHLLQGIAKIVWDVGTAENLSWERPEYSPALGYIVIFIL